VPSLGHVLDSAATTTGVGVPMTDTADAVLTFASSTIGAWPHAIPASSTRMASYHQSGRCTWLIRRCLTDNWSVDSATSSAATPATAMYVGY